VKIRRIVILDFPEVRLERLLLLVRASQLKQHVLQPKAVLDGAPIVPPVRFTPPISAEHRPPVFINIVGFEDVAPAPLGPRGLHCDAKVCGRNQSEHSGQQGNEANFPNHFPPQPEHVFHRGATVQYNCPPAATALLSKREKRGALKMMVRFC
jgi:hypothetical protein